MPVEQVVSESFNSVTALSIAHKVAVPAGVVLVVCVGMALAQGVREVLDCTAAFHHGSYARCVVMQPTTSSIPSFLAASATFFMSNGSTKAAFNGAPALSSMRRYA